jgi:hypothetical protein
LAEIVELLARWCASGPVRLAGPDQLWVTVEGRVIPLGIRAVEDDQFELTTTWSAPNGFLQAAQAGTRSLADMAQGAARQRTGLLICEPAGSAVLVRMPVYLEGLSRQTFVTAAAEIARAYLALDLAAQALGAQRQATAAVDREVTAASRAASDAPGGWVGPSTAAEIPVRCANCGAPQAGGKPFCTLCGRPMTAPATAVANPARVPDNSAPGFPAPSPQPSAPVVAGVQPTARCSRCGAEIPPGNHFCLQCGAPAGEVAPAASRIATVPQMADYLAVSGANGTILEQVFRRLPRMSLAILAGFALACVSTSLDWIRASVFGTTITASGWSAAGRWQIADLLHINAPIDALLVLVLAGGGAYALLAPLFGWPGLRVPKATGLAGVLIIGVGAMELYYVHEKAQGLADPGIGLYLLIAGGALAAVCWYLESHRGASAASAT